MLAVRNHSIERGANSQIMFIDLQSTLIDIWRADFASAALMAEDAMERAEQLGGRHMALIAHAARAAVAAYTGVNATPDRCSCRHRGREPLRLTATRGPAGHDARISRRLAGQLRRSADDPAAADHTVQYPVWH